MQKAKFISFSLLLLIAVLGFSCEKEDGSSCESERNIAVTSGVTKRATIDPNSNAQHVFYLFNIKNSIENGSCKSASKPFFIRATAYRSDTQDFSNATEHETATLGVPALEADQIHEVVMRVDYHETGYYRVEWVIDHSSAIEETNETDNVVQVESFYVLVD